jgi:hypothetical protein
MTERPDSREPPRLGTDPARRQLAEQPAVSGPAGLIA